MSAVTAVIDHLPAGAHVVVPKVMYHGVLAQFQRYETLHRLNVSYYDAGDLKEMSKAIIMDKTHLVWVETPNNPDWTVTDIKAAAKITHNSGALLVTDCTGTPPCMTQALELGADISFHSATKYLNGHSDVSAGALSVRKTGKFWGYKAIILFQMYEVICHALFNIQSLKTLNSIHVTQEFPHFSGHRFSNPPPDLISH